MERENKNCGNQVAKNRREKKKRERERERNQLWQPSCRNSRGVRREKIRIAATKLLKMGRKKRKKRETNCGNQVAEIVGKKNLIVI